MELSFAGLSSADAGSCVQEMELLLLKEGVPSAALTIQRTSSETMDLGTVLGVSVDSILHAIGATGYIACFVKCIHEIATRRQVTVVIRVGEDKINISPETDVAIIEKAINQDHKTE